MKKFALALVVLALTGSATNASSLTDKAQMDLLRFSGSGLTANPLSKPETSSLSDRAMRLSPGVVGGGSTINPTAIPDDSSLSSKATRDLLRRAG